MAEKLKDNNDVIFNRLILLVPRVENLFTLFNQRLVDNLGKLFEVDETLKDSEDRTALINNINNPVDLMKTMMGLLQSARSGDILDEDVDVFQADIIKAEMTFKEIPLSNIWAEALGNDPLPES